MSIGAERQADKAGWGGQSSFPESWEEFDALPRAIKRVYWTAPYLYTAIRAVDHVERGGSIGDNVARQVRGMERDVRRETLRLYGRAHPQARTGRYL